MCKYLGVNHAIVMKRNAWTCAFVTDQDFMSLSTGTSVRTRQKVSHA